MLGGRYRWKTREELTRQQLWIQYYVAGAVPMTAVTYVITIFLVPSRWMDHVLLLANGAGALWILKISEKASRSEN